MLADQARQTSGCPSQEELAAYTAGKLPSRLLEVVAQHVAACPACQSSLEDVQSETDDGDTLIRKLRACVLPGPSHPPCQDAEQVTPPVTGDEVLTASESPPDDGPPLDPTKSAEGGDATPPTVFGQYELLEQIGHGGMGVVYKARQPRLKRLVALKMIRSGNYGSPGERARFAVECEALARLQHPHVVQVHEFNEQAGQLYMCMELMEGGTLADRLPSTGLPVREAAQLVQVLAETVHAAHQRHIVHRDLKPTNVLMQKKLTTDGTDDADKKNTVPAVVAGVPKICDFGLAKLLDADEGHTGPDAVMGTPSYMAPEQAEGRNTDVGPLTDVYALGAVLYQTLTGRPPFKGPSRMATLDLVRTTNPVPPSRIRREVPKALEAICVKCLAKKPGQRYGSAQALAEDLGRWLRGAPTLVPTPPRVWRWVLGVGLGAAACLMFWLFSRPAGKRVFVPGVWHDLLDRRPTVLVRPLLQHGAWWGYEPITHEMWVNSDDVCIFQLGEVDATAFDLEVTFFQSPVVGGVGLIYQGRDDLENPESDPWGEFVLLRRLTAYENNAPAHVERGHLRRGAPHQPLFLYRLQADDVKRPDPGLHAHTLRATIGPTGLTNAYLDEREVQGKLFRPQLRFPRPGAAGIVGLMTQTTGATIRSARLRVFPAPP